MTKVEQSATGVIALNGELLFGTIMTVKAEVESLLQQQNGDCTLDFSGVTRVDSSALALWLSCSRLAVRKGITLRASGIPHDMESIADLVGLDGALERSA